MRPLYIFDLDGTLADIKHRRPLVEGEKKNWPAFFAACVDDSPMKGVVQTFHMLYDAGAELWIWSGRSDEVHDETVDWLNRNDIPFRELRMRKAGDHQPDEKLKASWLAELSNEDRFRLVAIFEDRDRMVKLWRDNGIPCFQVAPGDF